MFIVAFVDVPRLCDKMTSNDNQAAEKQVSFYLHGKHVLVVDVNRRNCDAAKTILSEVRSIYGLHNYITTADNKHMYNAIYGSESVRNSIEEYHLNLQD